MNRFIDNLKRLLIVVFILIIGSAPKALAEKSPDGLGGDIESLRAQLQIVRQQLSDVKRSRLATESRLILSKAKERELLRENDKVRSALAEKTRILENSRDSTKVSASVTAVRNANAAALASDVEELRLSEINLKAHLADAKNQIRELQSSIEKSTQAKYESDERFQLLQNKLAASQESQKNTQKELESLRIVLSNAEKQFEYQKRSLNELLLALKKEKTFSTRLIEEARAKEIELSMELLRSQKALAKAVGDTE